MPLFVKVNVRYLFLPIFPQLLPHFYQMRQQLTYMCLVIHATKLETKAGTYQLKCFALIFVFIVDITCYHNGYHGDLNETLFVGNVDEDSKMLVKTAYDSMMAGLDAGILQEGTFNYYICI